MEKQAEIIKALLAEVKTMKMQVNQDLPICSNCGKLMRLRKGKFGPFWSCEDHEGCSASFSDHKDKPVVIKCPACDKGYLRRAESKKKKGAYYWYCSDRCSAAPVWDKGGLPDLKGRNA